MSRNFTLKLCYVLCLALVLLVFPAKNYSATKVRKDNKKVEKAEKPVAQQESETLHSELLFR